MRDGGAIYRPVPRRGLIFPTSGIPEINESDVAAKRLKAAYLFGRRAHGIRADYGSLSVKTGTPGIAAGSTGLYTSYTQIAGHVAASGPSGDFSIIAVAMRGITPGASGTVSNVQVIATNVNIAATRNGFILALGNWYSATPNRINIEHYNAGVQFYTGNGWVDGKKETMVSGAGSTDLANGVWYGVGATYSNVAAGNGALTIADFVDNFFALTGGVQFLAVFDGILPDSYMSERTRNPANLLVWPEDGLRQTAFSARTVHNITATSIVTGAPEVSAPAVGQVHYLNAVSIVTGAPVVSAPTLGQIHALTASGIVTGAPEVSAPTVGQAHALAAVSIVTGAPVLSAPVLNASASLDRTLALPARSRSASPAARDRALALPARARTTTLQPERT